MPNRSASIAILLLAVLSAAAGPEPRPAAGPATQPAGRPAAPKDWVRQESGGKFHFLAPPELKEERVQGIDSLVGAWKSPAMSAGSDYGWYSDPLNYKGRPGYIQTPLVVGGKDAVIVSYEDKENSPQLPFFIGIHFPKVAGNGMTRLTVYVQCKDAATRETARRMLETIEFGG